MNNEVTEAKTTAVTDYGIDLGEQFGGADQKDLIMPKLLLMQPMHPLVVKEKKRQAGEIASSEDGSVIDENHPEGPIELVPFFLQKVWRITKPGEKNSNEIFVRIEESNAENSDWQWGAYEENGEDFIRRQSWYLYGYLAHELKEYGNAFPCVVEFRNTSFRIGKQIYSRGAKLRDLGQPLFFNKCILSPRQESNDKGTFYVWNLEWEKTTDEEKKCAAKWFKAVRSSGYRVKEEGQADTTESTEEEIPF